MSEVILGRTGLRSPKDAFGALPIQRISKPDAVRLVRRAAEGGFTFFDTARGYTDSEEKLGEAFDGRWEGITLATKTPCKDADGFWRDLNASLAALRRDCVEILQFHNPRTVPVPGDGSGMYEAMLEARDKGLVEHIGISCHRHDVAFEAVNSGLYETLQFPFSYLSSERDVELVRLCKEKQVGFISMKALSGGLLTNAAAARAWQDMFDNALPIWGIQRESELDDFLELAQSPPRFEGELKALAERDREELKGEFCRACGYCMPCPAGILINDCARLSTMIRRLPPQRFLTEENKAQMARIKDCTLCGGCKEKCPYGLDVPALLRRHLKDFEEILAGKPL